MSNMNIDPSELINLNLDINIIYWVINIKTPTIINVNQKILIIEGYDINIYLELKVNYININYKKIIIKKFKENFFPLL